MKMWVYAAVALVIAGIPAAYAASPNQEKPKSAQAQSGEDTAAKQCNAERDRIGVQAFKTKYGTNKNKANAFGKCVSGKSKDKGKEHKDEKDDDKDEAGKDDSAAAKACRAERASMSVDAFEKKYGTNHNLKNAFGKCVSGKSKKEKND
jgi:hypothetical protein